ncbi:PVC-type heme-binding CxxCH protein [Adhaeretor mobilis]|uniref:PVC-type heme-binding CxxCH protein n=1 Tax=Adhaeretor mobilis TaxID=1930276 RepID=UPI001C54C48F|nr:PVC-type heme-binding CxxCH protein [Adhaeretor mobilis]
MSVKLSLLFLVSLLGAASCLATNGSAHENYEPPVLGKSDEGELALQGFTVPNFLSSQLVAAEPDLANPVVFCFDEQGNLFVAETFRQNNGVEDNRSHMDWLEDDLRSQTVADREAMIRKYESDNLEKYTAHHDRIRKLTDSDHDGIYDTSTVYSDGYNQIVEGTGAGLLATGNSVYYTCIPNLWKLTDKDNDGRADSKEKLHSGYGVRFAFRGHDLHGLTWGPDGRLYFSIGDRGYNVQTAEGTTLARPNTGAVFRCWPDGSELEEFAYGLRNPQELAFDDYGNLFTGDNNSDAADEARWVHVCQGMDAGWRMHYQYLEDRGPWHRERMWRPYEWDAETTARQPSYIVPPIANLGNGPSGLVYYPGWGLPDRYAGHFFMADFRGTTGLSGIRSFAVKPKGAGFELIDSHNFIWGTLATDVDFGYDGRVVLSDWVQGWDGASRGRIYAFKEKDPSDLATEVPRLMAADWPQVSVERLVELLAHTDRRLRLKAQYELAARKEVQALVGALSNTNQLARIHAIWGLGQISRSQPEVLNQLDPLLEDADAEIAVQAASTLGDCARDDKHAEPIVRLLEHESDRVKYHAALALGKLKSQAAAPALLKMIAEGSGKDPVLRHAGMMGLAGALDEAQLAELSKHNSTSVRLAAVVALRRAKSERVVDFLADSEERVVTEAARAINDVPIESGTAQLASYTGSSATNGALLHRVLHANFRLGSAEHARVVIEMAGNSDLSREIRLEALHMLRDWKQPSSLDRVTNKWRPVTGDRGDGSFAVMLFPLISDILRETPELKVAALELAAEYPAQQLEAQLVEIVADTNQSAVARQEALEALDRASGSGHEGLLKTCLNDPAEMLRSTSRNILVRRHPEQAAAIMKDVFSEGSVSEKQAAIHKLSEVESTGARALLLEWFRLMIAGKVQPEIKLDLLTAAEKIGKPSFKAAIAEYQGALDAEDDLLGFRELLSGGNAERGKQIFFGSAAASCQRCHKVQGNGGAVGPELSGVGKDNPREYLLEAIVLPSKAIAKGFDTAVLFLDTGKTVTGIITDENEENLILVNPAGETILVRKEEIEERTIGLSGMPDGLKETLPKSDIRDLVEYLTTLRSAPDNSSHGAE